MKNGTKSKGEKEAPSNEAKEKRPYEPPAIEEEAVFESLSMQCNAAQASGKGACTIPKSS